MESTIALYRSRKLLPWLAAGWLIVLACQAVASAEAILDAHPRLYFVEDDLPRLRRLRQDGLHAAIWDNIVASARWCSEQPPRTEWIPTLVDDPQYENLYDRFYGAMHDMAVVEHLALTSALADPSDDPFFEPARQWSLAAAKIWRNEATNQPDASKAYAVLRVMKALAVAYDVLHDRLDEVERAEIRTTLVDVGRAYHEFFLLPSTAGEGYNKHHGSVDAAPFGIMALALLGEEPEARAWLDLAIEKHVAYLLPHALTASGTSDQSSNFWASTLQYRIFFLDALRRVTGRDLLGEFPQSLPGQIGLAAVAGPQPRDLLYNENQRSVLFAPSYGQINYWSPVLLYLARHHRLPAYQRLALWDESLGSLQRTRYITPTRGEELLFCFGPYAYLWYDPSVPTDVEADVPRTFEFPEPEVNEIYLRASYEQGGLVVGIKKGGVIVHAGGRPVLCDLLDTADINDPATPIKQQIVTDQRELTVVQCVGPIEAGIERQTIRLERPSRVTIERDAAKPLSWWYAGTPRQTGNRWTWDDGTTLQVAEGEVIGIDPQGEVDKKEHYGGMQYADPHPFSYPSVTVRPVAGRIVVEVEVPAKP